VASAARFGALGLGGRRNLRDAKSAVDQRLVQPTQPQHRYFLGSAGNKPIQGTGAACPPYAPLLRPVIGLLQGERLHGEHVDHDRGHDRAKYDTSAASSSFVGGKVTPGLDLSQLYVCVELPSSSARPQPGETVGVAVYYPFTGVTTMITRQTLYLNATSQYQVE
jgi:hypothetical protein